MSRAISTRMPAVAIEYDAYGHRRRKVFAKAYEGRSFYVAKYTAGKNPKVCKLTRDEERMLQ